VGAEADDFLRRHGVLADRAAAGEEAAQQAHRLEEIEAVAGGVEPLGYRGVCSPARGGHRLTISRPSLTVATSWVKELMEA
jgi:hypothetical protein